MLFVDQDCLKVKYVVSVEYLHAEGLLSFSCIKAVWSSIKMPFWFAQTKCVFYVCLVLQYLIAAKQ